GDALALCRWLVDVANERGGHDNVTVAVLMESMESDAGTPGAQASSTAAEQAAQSTPLSAAPSPPADSAPLASSATAPVVPTLAATPSHIRGRWKEADPCQKF